MCVTCRRPSEGRRRSSVHRGERARDVVADMDGIDMDGIDDVTAIACGVDIACAREREGKVRKMRVRM